MSHLPADIHRRLEPQVPAPAQIGSYESLMTMSVTHVAFWPDGTYTKISSDEYDRHKAAGVPVRFSPRTS